LLEELAEVLASAIFLLALTLLKVKQTFLSIFLVQFVKKGDLIENAENEEQTSCGQNCGTESGGLDISVDQQIEVQMTNETNELAEQNSEEKIPFFENKGSKQVHTKFQLQDFFILVCCTITFLYCLVELAAALWISSLTLMTDAFHKLSDVLSVFIAFWAIKASQKQSSFTTSFGWARTEIVGSLTNAIFLLSLCLYIFLDCIPQFIEKPTNDAATIQGAVTFVVVAVVGLIVNLFGTIIFAKTGYQQEKENLSHTAVGNDSKKSMASSASTSRKKKSSKKKKMGLNLKAVFLHYLGDSITSIFVLIVGAALFFFTPMSGSSDGTNTSETALNWLPYLDPAVALVIIIFILATTLPLTRECKMILLQSAPKHLDSKKLQRQMFEAEGVLGAHALHIWEFIEGVLIGSVHIKYHPGEDSAPVVKYRV
jgi:zinc transporter 1